ncbi:hypothetical protein JTE90_022129 [Oedothorax gibbosus]|uniref:Sulfatase N-terminal domain-containing protein n=1 Tax=Oedothorax gibbosus TaxID=931172 RepID=A0AAV6VSK1_9ARAC|nr:hypothetical protein JTE90_022129 [Oedothorax gibbosus]
MSNIYEQNFQRRSLLILVLVGIFVISVICVSIPLLILRGKQEDDYLGKPNILLIIVDDLRPALGCYGDKIALTPNIDQLASKGVLFKSAYVQEALGAPSRTSFLTSRRPDTLHVYDSNTYWRDIVGNFSTLPQHFKFHGYETISVGKVFPHGMASNLTDDYPYSWTKVPYHPPTQGYENQPICPLDNGDYGLNLICPVNLNATGSLPDIEATDYAISYLQSKASFTDQDIPFFLGVGYYKPHIPFQIPREYLDLHPIEKMELAPNNNIVPESLKIAWNPWTDFREKDDMNYLNVSFPYGTLTNDTQLLIRQAYYASVSYVDDQIGKLLHALETTGHAEHTTVVLVGDNGFSLGEHQAWSKYSNFEVALKVPLIVYIPELMDDKKNKNPFQHHPVLKYAAKEKEAYSPPAPKYVIENLVELVDIFPTLTKIADIPIPPLCRVYSTTFCSEGLSFYTLIKQLVADPTSEFTWKTATFSQYPRPSLSPQQNSDRPDMKDIKYMGYSVRTGRFRYTEWLEFNISSYKPIFSNVVHRELYDHEFDPHELDNKIEAGDYLYVARELSIKIKKGWRHAMPPGMFDNPTNFL